VIVRHQENANSVTSSSLIAEPRWYCRPHPAHQVIAANPAYEPIR
jgi:hypothetical protein